VGGGPRREWQHLKPGNELLDGFEIGQTVDGLLGAIVKLAERDA
jgi:hypothetical protein